MITVTNTPSVSVLLSAVRNGQVQIAPCSQVCGCGSGKLSTTVTVEGKRVVKTVCPCCGK